MEGSLEEKLKERVNVSGQFSYENGVTVTRVEPDLAEGELRAGEKSLNPHGVIHGGALYTLADTVGGCCACSRGGRCVTANGTVEYLRPAQGERVSCRAWPKKMGRQLSVIAVELRSGENAVVATGTFTYAMLEPGQTVRKGEKDRGKP